MKNKIILPTLLFLGFLCLPKITQAATLFLSPASGSFVVGQTITVTIRTNTQNDAVNTAEARISYSTDTLNLVRATQGSTFFLAAPGSPTKGSGTAYIGGGLPTPGYTGTSGLVGTLTFQALAQGTATVSITDGKVLLNDGFGTNALSSSSGARFTIGPPAVGTPQVTSSTHPDSAKWYAADNVELSWSRPATAYGFSFELTPEADTMPDSELETTVTTTKSYPDLKDGVWYFHIRARAQNASAGFGGTAHFKINIDTKPPVAFEVKLVGEDINQLTTATPTVSFETKDELSGIDHYSVFLNGKLYRENITSPFTFDRISGGEQSIKVVAFDRAGNQTASEISINVASGRSLTAFLKNRLSLPLYAILLFNLFFLILIALLLLILFRKKSERASFNPDVKQIQQDIDESLENLKQEISQKLLGLTAKSSEELFEKEAQVTKELRSGIIKTRKKIDKNISRFKKNVKNGE